MRTMIWLAISLTSVSLRGYYGTEQSPVTTNDQNKYTHKTRSQGPT